MEELFAKYADEDDPSVIGAEGLETFCGDAGISLEGPEPLILAWLLDASDLGKFSKKEWTGGLHALKIDTLDKLRIALKEHEDLLIYSKPPIPPTTKGFATDPYNRNHKYAGYSLDPEQAFDRLYAYVFSLAKSEQERSIDIEIAKAFWSTVLAPKFPLVHEFLAFLTEGTKLRGVNKDLWAMTLEFFKTVDPNLENFDTDGAWPSTIDDFVSWKKHGKEG